jgi:dUTP pyrophosphatase
MDDTLPVQTRSDLLTEYHCVRLQVKFIHEDAKLPYRKRPTDAGYDLFSIENVTIPPGNNKLIRTGIQISCPPGYYYTIEGRSSLWMKGIFPNRGIIDATYTGEVVVSLVNVNNDPFEISKGQRIAQLIIQRQYDAEFVEVSEFGSAYNQRGSEGFGSTGE